MTDDTVTPEDAATPPAVPEAVLEQIRAAEVAAQASLCAIPNDDRPADLDKALDRRIAVNLERTGGQEPIRRLGSNDPEVLRLEAPYRLRRSAGDTVDEKPAPKTRGSHRRRATKKAPATKKENS